MRTTRRWTAGVLLGLVPLLVGSSARAEPPAVEGALWFGLGGVGGVVDPMGGQLVLNSVLLGLSLSARLGHVRIGGSADEAGELFGHHEGFRSIHGGWTAAIDGGRLSLLGEVGRHSYEDVGADLFLGGTKMKVTLPFVGLRVVKDVSSRSEGQGALFGMWVTLRQDIGTATAYQEAGFSGSGGAWQVGGMSITGGVRVGFDLGAGGPAKVRAPAARK